MEKKNLYKMAEEARAKVEEYRKSLESYPDEIKESGRDVTKEDTTYMQGITEKLLDELNRHTEIYKQIYAVK